MATSTADQAPEATPWAQDGLSAHRGPPSTCPRGRAVSTERLQALCRVMVCDAVTSSMPLGSHAPKSNGATSRVRAPWVTFADSKSVTTQQKFKMEMLPLPSRAAEMLPNA